MTLFLIKGIGKKGGAMMFLYLLSHTFTKNFTQKREHSQAEHIK